ncbi:MAG: GDSL-type esterase/lipase family protein [Verrucomicrobia bacterium]|nr:GDSL-type esterase/lipase family protein [Verrucomicrobiota bacterium]
MKKYPAALRQGTNRFVEFLYQFRFCKLGLSFVFTLLIAGNSYCRDDVTVGPTQAPAAKAPVESNLPDPIPEGRFELKQNDVVAFVGGADVSSAQYAGHLEALLTARYSGSGVRFRNFGWEGDTVNDQPRDVGFPSLIDHLAQNGVTVIIVQYGRGESLSGSAGLPGFITAYSQLMEEFSKLTPRLLLVTPHPFEKGGGSLPDLSQRNSDLEQYSIIIRAIARQRKLPVIDLFAEFGGESHSVLQLTQDGLQVTPRGHGLLAAAFVRQLGFSELAGSAGAPSANGVWPVENFEKLRQAVIAKNTLWFNYWRPQNWAFLGGDRTSQPSSRDHRDPSIRWFPEEMHNFVSLIEAKEAEIAKLAADGKP